MNVHFVTENKYPDVSAAANRLSLLIKALEYEDVNVDVLSIGYFKTLPIKANLLISFFIKVVAIFKVFYKVKKKDIVFFYGPFRMPWIPLMLKFRGVKMVSERTEFPHHIILNNCNTLDIIKSKLAIKSMGFSNGFITCSKVLKDYYCENTGIKDVLIIPLIIDHEIINCYANEFKKEISYCGYMGNNKDGIFDLITSFKKVNKFFPDWKLHLIGYAEESVMEDLKKITLEYGIADSVVFTGKQPHKKVLELLNKSSILALARPNNKQAQGGFPSKLGEYLSTKLPVVVTSVGEIPNYIQDGVTGFLANPDDPDNFAERLIYVIKNYEEAKQVGLNGEKLAANFDYKVQGKRIFNFIKN